MNRVARSVSASLTYFKKLKNLSDASIFDMDSAIKPSIVVTGSSGYLGRKLINRLKELEIDVIGLDLNDPENSIDLCNLEQLQELSFPSSYIFIHLAFPLPGQKPTKHFERIVRRTNENLITVLNPLDMLFISSTAVYALETKEDQFASPWEIYGKLKYESELLFASKFKKLTVFRPGTLVEANRNSLMMSFIKHLSMSPIVFLPGSGDIIHPFTNTNDLVDAILLWVSRGTHEERVFNLVANEPLSLRRLSEQDEVRKRHITLPLPVSLLRKIGSDKHPLFGISRWHFSALTYNFRCSSPSIYTSSFLNYDEIFKL